MSCSWRNPPSTRLNPVLISALQGWAPGKQGVQILQHALQKKEQGYSFSLSRAVLEAVTSRPSTCQRLRTAPRSHFTARRYGMYSLLDQMISRGPFQHLPSCDSAIPPLLKGHGTVESWDIALLPPAPGSQEFRERNTVVCKAWHWVSSAGSATLRQGENQVFLRKQKSAFTFSTRRYKDKFKTRNYFLFISQRHNTDQI